MGPNRTRTRDPVGVRGESRAQTGIEMRWGYRSFGTGARTGARRVRLGPVRLEQASRGLTGARLENRYPCKRIGGSNPLPSALSIPEPIPAIGSAARSGVPQAGRRAHVAWFNNERLHTSLGGIPPTEHERQRARR